MQQVITNQNATNIIDHNIPKFLNLFNFPINKNEDFDVINNHLLIDENFQHAVSMKNIFLALNIMVAF